MGRYSAGKETGHDGECSEDWVIKLARFVDRTGT